MRRLLASFEVNRRHSASATELRYNCRMLLVLGLLTCSALIPVSGCGSPVSYLAPSDVLPVSIGPVNPSFLSLPPETQTAGLASSLRYSLLTNGAPIDANGCSWNAEYEAIHRFNGDSSFTGVEVSSPAVSVTCEQITPSAVAVSRNPHTIRITHGGTYSGQWSSNDPKTPAVMILTDDPVIIKDSTVAGPGTLIIAYGGKSGGHLTVTNTTGIGQDPAIAGMSRGKFLDAQVMSSLTVTNCSMQGTAFGISIVMSTLSSLTLTNNLANNLDDRRSDGAGGYLVDKPVTGHFILMNQSSAVNGGTIAWNQIINAPGQASINDIINFYESRGGDKKHPIVVHDNYLEGAFSAGSKRSFTGGGIQMDGDSDDSAHANAFFDIFNNVVVRSANFGISVAAGHDISVHNNRVVSCGHDGQGHWLNYSGSAYGLWNYYNTHQFYNNSITENSGGLIRVIATKPTDSDFYTPSTSNTLNNTVMNNSMDHPCWKDGNVSQAAEETERRSWLNRLSRAGKVLGDLHL